MAQTYDPEPMRYHGPGWEITSANEVLYQLWAPQGEVEDFDGHPIKLNNPRDHWAACWSANGGLAGDFLKGPTLEEVLIILPKRIADAFRKVAQAHEQERSKR